MKFRVHATQEEAEAALQQIYADMVKNRAAEHDGMLDDWSLAPKQPVPVGMVPDQEIHGDRFPLYGRKADSMSWVISSGHTKSWSVPMQTVQGTWVFPSPDETGVDDDPSWWPSP